MALFIYLPKENGLRDRVMKVLAKTISPITVEIFVSIDEFSLRLRRPHFNINVMVLFVVSSDDLPRLLQLSELLLDKKLILVLPDDKTETIKQAHTLMPRFVTWMDSDFSDLATVLKRMLELYDYSYSEGSVKNRW